jgi:hypothetical protein
VSAYNEHYDFDYYDICNRVQKKRVEKKMRYCVRVRQLVCSASICYVYTYALIYIHSHILYNKVKCIEGSSKQALSNG